MIAPGAWLGVLGGGQLGRMFAMAAHRLGYRVAVLDPDPECPAAGCADRVITASLDDKAAWRQMAECCEAVTIETESVPADALKFLAQRVRVTPDARAIATMQDRALEKRFLSGIGCEVAPFAELQKIEDLESADVNALVPGLLKTCRDGYDGKGQRAIASREDLERALAAGNVRCVLERKVKLAGELSVILARSDDGCTAVYPPALNRHEAGVLDLSVVPAPLDSRITDKAIAIAQHIASALDYCGVLCVEYFLTDDGRLLVNELAPRPHNSGHYTVDACETSQFEQQVRVLAQIPLGPTELSTRRGAVAMANLLGDLWHEGEPAWQHALAHPDARLHLYGKRTPRAGRKMGHLTCIGRSADAAAAAALDLRAALSRGRRTASSSP